MLKAMQYVKKEGLARYTGIATHTNEPEAIRAAADVGIHDIVMTSYNFMMKNRTELEDAVSYAAGKGLGIIAMKTMAGAFWDKERTKPINSRAALKWVIQNKNIHSTVPDCSDFDQLAQDIEVMLFPQLSNEEIQDLTPTSGMQTSELFCQQCGECLHQCPHRVDIPTLMRSYMYAYGHHNFLHAHNTLASAGLSSNPCSGCTVCNIRCRMGFDVRTKIQDISRIIDIPKDFLYV
jgi:predicted aldo/keto reductase-like oxidoreductase